MDKKIIQSGPKLPQRNNTSQADTALKLASDKAVEDHRATKARLPADKKAKAENTENNFVGFDKPQIMAMSNIAKIISTYDLGSEEQKQDNQINNDA